jgi:hypothetical protein
VKNIIVGTGKLLIYPFSFFYNLLKTIILSIIEHRLTEGLRKVIVLLWSFVKWSNVNKTIKWFVVLFKQIFFNTSYDLFPIFLIWIVVWGMSYIFGLVLIHDTQTLINFIVAFSILLAIFQFFLQRHEEKLFAKIALFPRKIEAIIIEETNFAKFYVSIEKSSLRDRIKSVVDPKLAALDLLNRVMKDTGIRALFNEMKRTHHPIPIQFILNNQYDSDQRYIIAENSLDLGDKMNLFVAYKQFFLDVAYEKILQRIENEIDIQEFSILAQSNINIIQEVLPDFINKGLQKEFDKIALGDHTQPEIVPEASFKEYRDYIRMKILTELQQKIIL